jgi:hypothetical protein
MNSPKYLLVYAYTKQVFICLMKETLFPKHFSERFHCQVTSFQREEWWLSELAESISDLWQGDQPETPYNSRSSRNSKLFQEMELHRLIFLVTSVLPHLVSQRLHFFPLMIVLTIKTNADWSFISDQLCEVEIYCIVKHLSIQGYFGMKQWFSILIRTSMVWLRCLNKFCLQFFAELMVWMMWIDLPFRYYWSPSCNRIFEVGIRISAVVCKRMQRNVIHIKTCDV